MEKNQYQQALQAVSAAFPGIFLVPMPAAARFSGFAAQSARNMLCQGRLPFKTVADRGKRFVPAPELARYLAEKLEAAGIEIHATNEEAAPAKTVGRKRKGGEA